MIGGDAPENARRLRELLAGRGSAAERDIVILNSAALLMTAGVVEGMREGAELARESLGNGAARQVLKRFVEATND